jgi:hypothetical protein
MNFFDHKDLGNDLLQLCPKVVKHPVYREYGDIKKHTFLPRKWKVAQQVDLKISYFSEDYATAVHLKYPTLIHLQRR